MGQSYHNTEKKKLHIRRDQNKFQTESNQVVFVFSNEDSWLDNTESREI